MVSDRPSRSCGCGLRNVAFSAQAAAFSCRCGPDVRAASGVARVAVMARRRRRRRRRAIVFRFTPTERAQIAIWIESADGTFLRHGRADPGGQRARHRQPPRRGADEQRLPLALRPARRRAADLGAPPRVGAGRAAVPARHLPEPRPRATRRAPARIRRATRTSACRSARESTAPRRPRRGHLRERVQQRQGPLHDGGGRRRRLHRARGDRRRRQHGDRVRSTLTSLYPPRRDFVACADADHGRTRAWAATAAARIIRTRRLFADIARQVMPDIDAVTMATPPAGRRADGDVLGAGRPGRTATTSPGSRSTPRATTTPASTTTRYPTPIVERLGHVGDELRLSVPRPAVGRVQRPVHARQRRRRTRPMTPIGFGSVDGTDADAGAMHAMDGTITDDPQRRAGQRRGSPAPRVDADRAAGGRGSGQTSARTTRRPSAPAAVTAEPVADPKHSHQWGRLALRRARQRGRPHRALRGPRSAPATDRPRRRRRRSSRAFPARRRRRRTEALMVPVDGRRRRRVEVDFGGLDAVDALLGRRPRGRRLQPGRAARGRRAHHDRGSTTPSCRGCFIATAAWGSALEPTVAAMRRARDQLLADAPCSRSPPTSTSARGRPRRRPEAQRHGPGPGPPAARPRQGWPPTRLRRGR